MHTTCLRRCTALAQRHRSGGNSTAHVAATAWHWLSASSNHNSLLGCSEALTPAGCSTCSSLQRSSHSSCRCYSSCRDNVVAAAAATTGRQPQSTPFNCSSSSSSHRRTLSSSSRISASSSTTSTTTTSTTPPRPPPSGQEISSTANAYIKHCAKLRDSSRYRQQQRRLLVAGGTLLSELADASPGGLHAVTLFLKPGSSPPAGVSASSVITVSDNVMKKLTGLEETGGVQMAAELAMPPLTKLLAVQQQQLQQQQQQDHTQQQQQPKQQADVQPLQLQRLLVLEGVQDPGNLGTLLRCAAAFGWDAVWLLPGCCDPFNDKALRASRGAGFKVPMAAGTLEQLLQVVNSRGMLLVAAEPDPETKLGVQAAAGAVGAGGAGGDSRSGGSRSGSTGSNTSSSTSQPVALVLGSEGSGLSAEVLAVAQPLAVPMVGDMESLNVGVAGSILMFCLSGGLSQLTARLKQLQLLSL